MTAKFAGKVLLVVAFLCVFFLVVSLLTSEEDEPALYLALVGPMTGQNPENGRSYRQGVKLCVDRVNEEGGVNGRSIEVVVYDDQNDPALARERAVEIVEQNRYLAVIGHNYSTCSIAGGEVYKHYGMPAISPSSTAPDVTIGNDWYFRTVFSDNLEGSFLANYLAKVFRQSEVAVINEDTVYGRGLAGIFSNRCQELGVTVRHTWSYAARSPHLDQAIGDIVTELQASRFRGMILLATQAPEGVEIVRQLRDLGLGNQLLTPNAFASKKFQGGFGHLKKEQQHPGYYTNGTYVASPLLFDSANEEGQRFKERYRETFGGEEPDWRAAFAYDSALLLVEAIRATGSLGTDKQRLRDERKAIRDHLAGLTKIDDAVKGVTGFTYFDENGDPPRPIFLGQYRESNIISTLTQFQAIPDPRSIDDFEEAVREERILPINDAYMYKTNVVYTGVTINEISKLDMRNLSCEIDFNLWFRYQGDIDVSDIVFVNAVGSVELGEPVREEIFDQFRYRSYRVRSTFKADFRATESLEDHVLGISFYHQGLTRDNLIYVTDILGMGLAGGRSSDEQLNEQQVLSPSFGWTIRKVHFSQDVVERSPEGNPRYLNTRDGVLRHSRFNLSLIIRKERFGLRRTMPETLAQVLLVIGAVVLLASFVAGRLELGKRFHRLVWFFYVVSGMVVVLCGETVIIDHYLGRVARYYLELITLIFDILWWMAPAYFLIHTIETFVWTPLEHRARQPIPNIVRRFAAFLIYTLAVFGIIAFVFDQKITSLLATSGMIAMIIGLAIQINISNIFSGIALNLERPFKVGEWVRIGSLDEAKVLDMTWRTTRLLLRDNTVLNVPNSTAAEAQVINYSRPEPWYELWIYFHVDPVHSPERVIKITLDALSSMEIVQKDPKPACRLIGYTEWSAEYVAIPVLGDYGKRNVYRGAVMTQLWGELHRAGIRQAIRSHEVHMLRGAKESGALSSRREDVLESVDIFQHLSEESKAHLTANMQELHFEAAAEIVCQGDQGDSLFIIVEGVVGVWIKLASGESIEVDRMGAGTFFGEMALLTGEARTASVIAVTGTKVFKITKDHMAPLIEAQPELSKILSEELTRRTINRESKRNLAEAQKIDEKSLYMKMFHKIQTFFGK